MMNPVTPPSAARLITMAESLTSSDTGPARVRMPEHDPAAIPADARELLLHLLADHGSPRIVALLSELSAAKAEQLQQSDPRNATGIFAFRTNAGILRSVAVTLYN